MNPFDIQEAPLEPEIGFFQGISNSEYHSGPGVSKSQLDHIANNPSLLPWSKAAPVDDEKLAALDFGTALHTLLLEPELFSSQFRVAPKVNRQTKTGKAEEAEFIADCLAENIKPMAAEDHRKLLLMRESVMAHPTARWIMERDNGVNEGSIYWNDEENGELCRCRPDRLIIDESLIVDVKKIAGFDRIERHIEEYRYHVQQEMYSDGYRATFGDEPQFVFLFVSSTISAGRYPVDVIKLDEEWTIEGYRLFRRDLDTYSRCLKENDWTHIRTLNRPYWASR